jgi:hypothetical protein
MTTRFNRIDDRSQCLQLFFEQFWISASLDLLMLTILRRTVSPAASCTYYQVPGPGPREPGSPLRSRSTSADQAPPRRMKSLGMTIGPGTELKPLLSLCHQCLTLQIATGQAPAGRIVVWTGRKHPFFNLNPV